jgi:hypothetical protein
LHALGKPLDVEAAAAGQQRHAAPLVFGRDGGFGDGPEFLQVDRVVGFAQIEQFVAHLRPLGRAWLGGAHIHV